VRSARDVSSPSPEQLEYAVVLPRRAKGDLQACRALAALGFLVRQVRESGIEPPQAFSDAQWLTPWAAELCYDEPIALDRGAALAAAESAIGWAVSLLDDPTSVVPPDKTREEGSQTTSPERQKPENPPFGGGLSRIAGERFALTGDPSALVERVVPWPCA
jgi:hypothetical protein